MARIKIERGGKILIAVVFFGALLFTFFMLKGPGDTTRASSPPPPAENAQRPAELPRATPPAVKEEKPRPAAVVSQVQPAQNPKGPIRIFFDFNRATVDKNVYCIFDMIQSFIKSRGNGNIRITVEGNADSIGPSWYNLTLSQRRAERVVDSLSRRLSIPRARFHVVANGSSRPISSNSTPDGRSDNRRVEISIF